MVLSIEETYDDELINSFYADNFIYNGVKRDGVQTGFRSHPAIHYLLCAIDGKTAGFFIAVESSEIDWEMHACLMKWATPHSRSLAQMAINWVWARGPIRITVPVVARSTVNFCKRLGFEIEGVRRNGAMIDGTLHDVTFLGLLKWDSFQT
jgi:hypothetical protein